MFAGACSDRRHPADTATASPGQSDHPRRAPWHRSCPGIRLELHNWRTIGVLGALLAEHLNRSLGGRMRDEYGLAGFIALGVLLIPLLQLRIDVESLLCGALAANEGDLLRTILAGGTSRVVADLPPRFRLSRRRSRRGCRSRTTVLQLRFAITVVTALVVICSLTAVGVVLVIALLCAPVLIHLEQSTSLKALMLRALNRPGPHLRGSAWPLAWIFHRASNRGALRAVAVEQDPDSSKKELTPTD